MPLDPSISAIPLPLPHIGSVNAWLLRGDPLTLVDAGPNSAAAMDALDTGLRSAGVRVEDIELVLATHHHLDHVGLAPAVRRRSGATVAVLDAVADYVDDFHGEIELDRAFSHRLMAAHGVPDAVVDDNEDFWDYLRTNSASFDADMRLADGDVVRAGGRELEVLARPGHSRTDTLFVDAGAGLAFAGDHLLERVSSNTEIAPVGAAEGARPRPRTEYLRNLQRTAAMPLDTLLTGHGRPVTNARALVGARLAEHRARAARIAGVLLREPQTAYGIAGYLWPAETVREQPLLVVWEVLGHLELLLAAGVASEVRSDDGRRRFRLADHDHPVRPAALGAHTGH